MQSVQTSQDNKQCRSWIHLPFAHSTYFFLGTQATSSGLLMLVAMFFLFLCLFCISFEKERAREGQRQKGEKSLVGCALSTHAELNVRLSPMNPEIMMWAKIESWLLNWWSHSGAPFALFFQTFLYFAHVSKESSILSQTIVYQTTFGILALTKDLLYIIFIKN